MNAEEIVRELADSSPMAEVLSEYGIDWWECVFCGARADNVHVDPFDDRPAETEHNMPCLWAFACDWVETHR
jgi:hypothetical protein